MSVWLFLVAVITTAIYIKCKRKFERKAQKSWKTNWRKKQLKTEEHVFREKTPDQDWDRREDPTQEETTNQNTINYKDCYQAKYLLTMNEWYEYKKLREFAKEKNLVICPKVRLLDIIAPREDKPNRKALLWKVQSKHIDFVICDENMKIKAILELDDNSHNRPDRIERDCFVDEILTSVGYKVIHTRSITEYTLSEL